MLLPRQWINKTSRWEVLCSEHLGKSYMLSAHKRHPKTPAKPIHVLTGFYHRILVLIQCKPLKINGFLFVKSFAWAVVYHFTAHSGSNLASIPSITLKRTTQSILDNTWVWLAVLIFSAYRLAVCHRMWGDGINTPERCDKALRQSPPTAAVPTRADEERLPMLWNLEKDSLISALLMADA